AIRGMFDSTIDLHSAAVVEKFDPSLPNNFASGSVTITSYSENRVILSTSCSNQCFVVLTDSYYPTWKASIDGSETPIYSTDYAFRGVVVPSGKHTIEFSDHLF